MASAVCAEAGSLKFEGNKGPAAGARGRGGCLRNAWPFAILLVSLYGSGWWHVTTWQSCALHRALLRHGPPTCSPAVGGGAASPTNTAAAATCCCCCYCN
eukprot:COSAG01_NODE_3429_length_6104_cov_67.418748_5_plen_100_part_00